MKKISALTKSLLSTVVLMAFSGLAAAATAPTTPGTLGYVVYDLIMVKIYGSGGGYVAGILMLAWAFTKVKQDWREAGWIAVGGSGVLALPTIATALGAVVI